MGDEAAGTGSQNPLEGEGVLIRAENGDVIRYDETGLILRLSDKVIADLRKRLAPQHTESHARSLGDIDAWNLRAEGDWLHFTARIEAGRPPRDYRKPLAGGNIIADAIGPLQAILSLGGARRAGFNPGPVVFPYHILSPGDDIGAVGLEGTAEAHPTPALQRLPHATRDALIAETVLQARYDAMQSLPLIVVRTETDNSPSLKALAGGQAYANFLAALDSLTAAAKALDKRAQVLAVGIDHSLEDLQGDPMSSLRALRHLMDCIERDMAARHLVRPVFLLTAESGSQNIVDHPSIIAHAEAAWSNAPHRLVVSAPGYMFEQTRFARPTDTARIRMAEMDAHALTAAQSRKPWFCPQILLAEHQGRELRVITRAMGALVIDDVFGVGPGAGFAVHAKKPVAIQSVSLDPSDPQSLMLTLDRPIEGEAHLAYAYRAAQPSPDAFPANRGAIRDGWQAPSRAGDPLHRWALSAYIPCNKGSW